MTPLAPIAENLEQVCGWLTSPTPESLDRCARTLESAMCSLLAMEPRLKSTGSDASAAAGVRRLRSALSQAGRLLESAYQYHAQWRRRLGAATAGYRADGNPADLFPTRRVSLEG